jgi:hypothetical protein
MRGSAYKFSTHRIRASRQTNIIEWLLNLHCFSGWGENADINDASRIANCILSGIDVDQLVSWCVAEEGLDDEEFLIMERSGKALTADTLRTALSTELFETLRLMGPPLMGARLTS